MSKVDATEAIWQDPSSYDPEVHRPPYLREKLASAAKDAVKKELRKTAAGQAAGIFRLADSATPAPGQELTAVVVLLKALASLHQTHHWQTAGETYYADHLLFERLYSETDDEVDGVAEKAVGVSGPTAVDPLVVVHQVASVLASLTSGTLEPSEMVGVSLAAEKKVLLALQVVARRMRENGTLSRGIDNMLAGIEDKHESHVYLLQQRTSSK